MNESVERNRLELKRRLKAGELTGIMDALEVSRIRESEPEHPINRNDLDGRSLVISQSELEELGYLEVVLANGEVIVIDSDDTGYDDDEELIIFPEEVAGSAK